MNAASQVEVFPSRAALAEGAARRFTTGAIEAVKARGTFRVALSGGATPEPLYRLLATPQVSARIPWSAVEVYWNDERCVPPDDPASNFNLARATLLDPVGIDPARAHRMQGEIAPDAAAAAYERALREAFDMPEGPPSTGRGARFDLILLGLGPDGHVASLLPGLLPSPTTERWVVPVPASPWTRLTFTPALINSAREVMVLVSGSSKAAILRRVFESPRGAGALPAQLIHPGEGILRWMLDAEAAALLPV